VPNNNKNDTLAFANTSANSIKEWQDEDTIWI
jgi:hypothetical protein